MACNCSGKGKGRGVRGHGYRKMMIQQHRERLAAKKARIAKRLKMPEEEPEEEAAEGVEEENSEENSGGEYTK